jgi:hypothetical protein
VAEGLTAPMKMRVICYEFNTVAYRALTAAQIQRAFR